jgi:hypothetical protein
VASIIGGLFGGGKRPVYGRLVFDRLANLVLREFVALPEKGTPLWPLREICDGRR